MESLESDISTFNMLVTFVQHTTVFSEKSDHFHCMALRQAVYPQGLPKGPCKPDSQKTCTVVEHKFWRLTDAGLPLMDGSLE